MDSGNINVYSVQALSSQMHQPPPPLVKILKSDKRTGGVTGSKTKKSTKVGFTKSTSRDTGTDLAAIGSSGMPELPGGMNMERLMKILKGYGCYPDKYRMFIWRSILRLPENHSAYAALVDKGTHPAYQNLHETYPIKSRKLIRVLQRCLSALAHWSPIFGETDFLPMMAFPFVKIFQNNQLICFEVIASLLVNWCQHWFEYFPNPPINMLGLVENVLAHHDRPLLQHFVRHGVTSQMYAWPVLETMFSEVLTKEEWLRLFDNVFSNPPTFLLMAVVAYCTVTRAPLMRCTELDDFKFFFHHRNAVDVNQVIKEAYRLMDITPTEIHPQEALEEFTPLTRGQYPIFNKYPKFIVNYQVQEKERIRQEEVEFLRQRQASQELEHETARRQAEEAAWYRQQQLLSEAEEARRKKISVEEQKLADQRTRLTAMNRELKVRELQLMDATRRKFLVYQQQQKEDELKKLEDDLRRKALLRDSETQAAVDDAEIRGMELQVQRQLLEQEMHRKHVEGTQQQKFELEARQQQQQNEQRRTQELENAQRYGELLARKTLQQNLAHLDQIKHDASIRCHMETKQYLDEMEQENKTAKLKKLQDENNNNEDGLKDLMSDFQTQKLTDLNDSLEELNVKPRARRELDPQRITALETEVGVTKHKMDSLHQSQDTMFERLRDLRRHINQDELPSQDSCLNNTSTTSATLSLDRGRQEFESGEQELMADVRRLREKLAREARDKKPPVLPL